MAFPFVHNKARMGSKMAWIKTAFGWSMCDGVCRWTIRGPIMGKPMYWLYKNGSRFTPTGRYVDVVSCTTVREAKAKVELLREARR